MRCKACDVRLTSFESTRKSSNTGEYIDLCNHCFEDLDIEVIERYDLLDRMESNDSDLEDLIINDKSNGEI